MLTLINQIDFTSSVPHDAIQISTTAGDPLGKATFQVKDPGAQLSLSLLQEVIFIDETIAITPSGGSFVTSVPTYNFLANNNFNGVGAHASTAWSDIGSLTGRITYPPAGTYGSAAVATLTFSNQAIGSALAAQTRTNTGVSGTNYAIPGQTYCLSGTINVTSAFTNAYALLQIRFLDAGNNVLSTTSSSHITSTSGAQRFSVQATAPAGTVTLQAVFGGTTTNTTNSGTATFTALQFEPVWFPALYSYPTPICDWLQADSMAMNDESSTRFDRIFCGYISHLAVSYEGTTRTWDVEVTSLAGWLENVTLVNASYTNTTDQNIIVGIVNTLPNTPLFANIPAVITTYPQFLSFRNLPITYSGITVSTIAFADATLREVLNALSDMTGFLFGIDAYYNVYYYPPHYKAAPYSFVGNGTTPDNVTTFGYYDYSIEYDGTQLQSVINVSGGNYEVQITENFTAGDGTHGQFIVNGNQTAGFNLTFEPAGTIRIPQVTFGGTLQTTILDTGAGFGTDQTMLTGGDKGTNGIGIATAINFGTSISVTYTYSALVYTQIQSPDSISQYGRPLYSKINDTNLTSNASAVARGEAQLQAYAQQRATPKFKTTKMLQAGQTISLTSTLDGITNGHYTVQKVTASYLGNGINQYEIEAGTYVDDFVDFFRNSQKAINRADHDPAAPIQQRNNLQQDSLSLADSLNIHT